MLELTIDRARAALLIVDIQERLAAAMPAADLETCQRNVTVLIELARRLEMPVVVSEQYPKGLGPTTARVEQALAGLVGAVVRFEKVDFSCTNAPPFARVFAEVDRTQWIVTGMETHVCVYQTARGLVGGGATVHVVSDAVCSRAPANRQVGLSLCERAGALVTCTETVVFDALARAGSEDFKAMSALVR